MEIFLMIQNSEFNKFIGNLIPEVTHSNQVDTSAANWEGEKLAFYSRWMIRWFMSNNLFILLSVIVQKVSFQMQYAWKSPFQLQ